MWIRLYFLWTAKIHMLHFRLIIHFIFLSFFFFFFLCYCCFHFTFTSVFTYICNGWDIWNKKKIKIAADSATFQLSPIVFGIVLTLIILASYCFVRIFISRRQQKNDTTIDSSKQSSSLLCNGVGGSGGSTGASNAVSLDTTQKVCI